MNVASDGDTPPIPSVLARVQAKRAAATPSVFMSQPETDSASVGTGGTDTQKSPTEVGATNKAFNAASAAE